MILRPAFNKRYVSLVWRKNVFKPLGKPKQFSHFGIVKSSSSDVVIPKINVSELVFSKTEDYDKYTAIECCTTGKQYTFGDLKRTSINFGQALRKKLKLKKGDVVALLLFNCPEFAVAVLGTLSAGIILTTLNPLYTPGEISKQLVDSRTKVIVTKTHLYSNVRQALILAKMQIPVIVIKEEVSENLPSGIINFEELINAQLDIPDVSDIGPNDLAFLPYSSGTTGLPKGVQLTHNNLVANLCQVTHPDFNHSVPPSESHQDVFPLLLPMFHLYGFACGLLKQLLYGSKILTVSKFNPESFVSLLQDHPVTHLYIAPPLVIFLTTNPKVTPEHFKALRKVVSAAAPLSHSDELRFLEKIRKSDAIIGQAYGLTETSPIISWPRKDHKASSKNGGTTGKIVPNTYVKFVAHEENGSEEIALGPNEVGELLVKGPQNTPGYYNRPEDNERLFSGDWLRTGDLGYYNEDGYLFITDRLKELIKVKGFQVAPAELEAIIRSYPPVQDVAVIGIPHPRFGEVPRAYVVAKKGHLLKSKEIENFVANKVVQYKHLVGGIQMVDVIPKNPSGKILRRTLKKQYQETGI